LRVYRFRSSTRPSRAKQTHNEYEAIAAALCARDAEGAEERMREHIRQWWKNFEARSL
jgi:DNA-binding GntR family transcriptional regulator